MRKQDNWAAIRGMRNRIVHAYTGVDHTIVKATVSNDLPILEQSLKKAKTRLDESPQD
ncbi:HepT-like ribonuclease domain-containing protein [Gleimia hominis]|uniref:HepT-like ribonuclease domain-containing protein n=1 Tax=Gleimia hominis TaxID=595468 RepID=UPI003305ED45